ncbi:MAG TPA: tetratricopeptide repeat protein [Bacillota bacterium]|nr:tetratricopeptide repeat protein [Bacillota bacterium]
MIQIIPFRYSEQPEYLPMLARGLADLANLWFNMMKLEAQINLELNFTAWQRGPVQSVEDLSGRDVLFSSEIIYEEPGYRVSLCLAEPSQDQSFYYDTYQTTERNFLKDWEVHLEQLIFWLSGEETLSIAAKKMYTHSLDAFLAFRKGLEILTLAKKQAKQEEGLDQLLTAIAFDPDFAEAVDILLLFLMQIGTLQDYEYALRMLERLKDYADRHPRIQLVGAELYFQWGNHAKAERLLIDLVRKFPEFFDGWIRLALFYQSRNETMKALSILQSLHERHPQNAAVLDLLGAIYVGLENYEDAESAWLQTLELEPGRVNVLNNLGLLSEERGDPEQAEHYYLKAIHQNDQWWGSFYNYGSFCRRYGRIEEGIFLLNKARVLNPGHFPTYLLLAECQLELGYYDDAEEVLLLLLQIAPNNTVRRHVLTILEQYNQSPFHVGLRIRKLERMWEEGRRLKVIGGLVKNFRKAKDLWNYWYLWSIVLERFKLGTLSLAALRAGYRRKPAFPLAKKLGLSYWAKGQFSKALPFLRTAFQLNRSDKPAVQAYLQTLISLGEMEEYEQQQQQVSRISRLASAGW